jgi:hypothetical protein
MESAMKNTILRILIGAIRVSLISGFVVSVIGLMLRWKTSTQFSDGFFLAGIIMVAIAFVNAMGRVNQPNITYSQSALSSDRDERFKLWTADTFHGYNILAFLGISGLLLFGLAGLALLVGRLFQCDPP